MPVRTCDTPQDELRMLHDTSLPSWRKIALLEPYRGIPPGTLATIAKHGIVPNKWRVRFGLPLQANVTVVFGEVPEGAQTLFALKCRRCGSWYIPNSPRRMSCFVCSPYKGRR